MGSKTIPVLFVTANVGSIFEDPSVMLKIWTEEFLSTVAKLDPKFIALHCQEVGGKNYEKSMKYVEDFVKLLMTSEELRLFDKVRVFIDEDYSSAENFTALGNIYFVHESIDEVLIWDFKDMNFTPVTGTEINTGNIEGIVTKEKAKFPQDFFPECKWSRKGFLRTRWSLSGTVFDLINIHLFHDASNFIAMEEFPSVYCKNRRRALEHTLQRFHNDRNGTAPFFLFGDFNFRTDTDGVVKKLTEGLTTTKVQHQLQFHNDDNKLVLTVGKKEFNHSDHQDVFLSSDGSWLQSYDRELEAFENQLFEFVVNFSPSYPFEEKVSCATTYMPTRCPAWCDRVLLSHTAKSLVDDSENVEYSVIGRETCMGDHKPVYLRLGLHSESGTVSCCEHTNPCLAPPALCKCCQNYASIEINITDMSEYLDGHNSFVDVDSSLLHEPFTRDMLMHDPYTPESAESHSPLPLTNVPSSHTINFGPHRQKSVSPRILKSRLETILRSEQTDTQLQSNEMMNFNVNNNKTQSSPNLLDSSKPLKPEITTVAKKCLKDTTKHCSRVRLISTSSAQSVSRLHSHHSSSDEDWFEFDDTHKDSVIVQDGVAVGIGVDCKDDVFVDNNTERIELTEDSNKNIRKKSQKKNRKNHSKACCCTIC